MSCDVSEEEAVEAMLKDVRHIAGNIKGIIHCAGVIRDGTIEGGKAAAGSTAVWQSKALSAWWLHKHSLEDNLNMFVTYSSISAAIGNHGQTAYAAANRFLDALIHIRVHA